MNLLFSPFDLFTFRSKILSIASPVIAHVQFSYILYRKSSRVVCTDFAAADSEAL